MSEQQNNILQDIQIDMDRLPLDEEYYNSIEKLIMEGKIKPTEDQKPWIRIACGKHWRKHIPPSKDPRDHQNDVSKVRRVGVSGFFQHLSDMFVGM
jgi:hypothetical protein